MTQASRLQVEGHRRSEGNCDQVELVPSRAVDDLSFFGARVVSPCLGSRPHTCWAISVMLHFRLPTPSEGKRPENLQRAGEGGRVKDSFAEFFDRPKATRH